MTEHANPANAKPPPVDRLSQLWRRINDHKLVQWSVAYVALAYGVQHGVELTSDAFDWPHAVVRISMLLLVLGLPLVMTLAWYHGERASRRVSGPELTIISLLLVGISFLFFVFAQPSENVAAGPKPSVQQAGVASAVPDSGAISIAVLPFANLSGDASQEFFSDGMTEEITSALAKVADLRVVARASAFQFKGEKKDMRAVGQALSARYLIDGSVRKAGTRVRISAQLIEAGNGLQVWTENYDRELTDIFATQEDIAQAIVGALRVPLGLQQGERLVSNRIADVDSYQQFLLARSALRGNLGSRGLRQITDATALLEQIVARDPNYAPAWALLGQAYAMTPIFNGRNRGSVDDLRRIENSFLPKAEAAARRAIQLDANLADGYLALALVEPYRGDLVLVEDLFKRALALDPNNAEALNQYSEFHGAVGRLKDALAMRSVVRALEPLVPIFDRTTAEIAWLNGQNDVAISMLKALPPGVWEVSLARIYAAMGRYGEAADVLLQTPPGTDEPGTLEEAARLLRTAPNAAASSQSLPAFVYLYTGTPNQALESYERLVDAGGYTAGITFARLWHSSYAAIRKTQRFKSFVRKVGLVDYWRARGWPEFCHPTSANDFVCD